MVQRYQAFALLVFCLCIFSGCTTHRALRRNTVRQAETVTDLHQQQVLDNLAKFLHDPYAVPSFALATLGTSDVTDVGGASSSFEWMASGFDGASLSADGKRTAKGTWTMTPVTDPRKLELMRCAYQRVLGNCGIIESPCCPDCTKRFNKFYVGRSYGSGYTQKGERCYEYDESGQVKNLVPDACDRTNPCSKCRCQSKKQSASTEEEELPLPGDSQFEGGHHWNVGSIGNNEETAQDCKSCTTPSSGIVTSECLYPRRCWFRRSCNRKDVPKHCQLYGHYCGTYVWVPCGPGRDKLAKLTLAILDYAMNKDREIPTKEVVAYMKRDGTATSSSKAELVVKSVISADEPSPTAIAVDVRLAEAVARAALEKKQQALAEDVSRSLNAKNDKAKPIELTFDDLRSAVESKSKGINGITLDEDSIKEVNDMLADEIELGQQRPDSILNLPPVRPLPQQRSPTPGAGLLMLEQQLETVR